MVSTHAGQIGYCVYISIKGDNGTWGGFQPDKVFPTECEANKYAKAVLAGPLGRMFACMVRKVKALHAGAKG
jgi:hypothetical protein